MKRRDDTAITTATMNTTIGGSTFLRIRMAHAPPRTSALSKTAVSLAKDASPRNR